LTAAVFLGKHSSETGTKSAAEFRAKKVTAGHVQQKLLSLWQIMGCENCGFPNHF
jgi:hypothetical protein